MSDPQQPGGFDPTRQGGPAGYPPYPDPAYAGQVPPYGGYPPAYASSPTEQLAQQPWAPGQPPPGQPPTDGPGDGGDGGPPEPPRSPKWLFLLAGAAVLLVVGMVIALVIANGASKKSASISRLPSLPGTTAPSLTPSTTPRWPSPTTTTSPTTTPSTTSPGETTTAAGAQTYVYSVTGEGRAISIAYMDTGGVLQTEFNVELPWTKEVTLSPPASSSASVTVVNIGQQVTCSVTADGAKVRERTGSILTVCAVG